MGATEAFEQVQKAYKTLYNPDERRAYDASLEAAAAPTRRNEPEGPNIWDKQEFRAYEAGRYNEPYSALDPRWWKKRQKYPQFSQSRSTIPTSAKPILSLAGVFLICGALPIGLVALSSEQPSE